MVVNPNPCFCINLESAGFLIGIIELVAWLYVPVFSAQFWCQDDIIRDGNLIMKQGFVDCSPTLHFIAEMAGLVLSSFIYFISVSLLFMGLVRRSPCLLLPWIIVKLLVMAYLVIATMTGLCEYISDGALNEEEADSMRMICWSKNVAPWLYVGISAYFTLVGVCLVKKFGSNSTVGATAEGRSRLVHN